MFYYYRVDINVPKRSTSRQIPLVTVNDGDMLIYVNLLTVNMADIWDRRAAELEKYNTKTDLIWLVIELEELRDYLRDQLEEAKR